MTLIDLYDIIVQNNDGCHSFFTVILFLLSQQSQYVMLTAR